MKATENQAMTPEFPVMVGLAARTRLCKVLEKKLLFGGGLAVLVIEVSGMGRIIHSKGYDSGVTASRELVHRINAGVENVQFVGRLGGGRFLAVAHAQKNADKLSASIERLLADISLPIKLSTGEVYVSCSIGASVALQDKQDARELLSNGELALGSAMRGGFALYQPECRDKVGVELGCNQMQVVLYGQTMPVREPEPVRCRNVTYL
ncbi:MULTISPECIES: diguanylate cyclase domain-containing protein [Marinobacter]|uniref:diguanylate cyclase domain-containing protein n=1 Tax=Marinobacter TaxID=2742 RepID=UPI0012470F14|nr:MULTISPECIES: GGDEF domain-containing protein [Marinobacter]MBL3558915.1 GGDEF domain-containing protein [Marinobacter sp. JB05H06]